MKKIMFNEQFGLQQATFDGTKTMTRRVVPDKILDKWYEFEEFYRMTAPTDIPCYIEPMEDFLIRHAPYEVGEVVAIAQRYSELFTDAYNIGLYGRTAGWDNKMFVKAELMPHHIKIIDRKLERLQDISDEDCLREGILIENNRSDYKYGFYTGSYMKTRGRQGTRSVWYKTPRKAYADLIDKVSGKGTWNSNPLVFAYEYKRID